MTKIRLLVCHFNFLMAAIMGLMLRLTYLIPPPTEYRYLVHGHSHTALLGWAYLMIFCFYTDRFVPPDLQHKYNRIFIATQTSVIGMMLTFPFTGYALFSIIFSTLHILCSYVFSYRIFRDIKMENISVELMVKSSLIFMILSTFGVWSLGIIKDNQSVFQSAIQFFLHFQFNGWFVFAVLAILLDDFAKTNTIDPRDFKWFYRLQVASTILTYALPLDWYFDFAGLYAINSIGVILQLAALIFFIRILHKQHIRGFWLLSLAVASLALKAILQIALLIPGILDAAGKIRDLIIGFIHLTMLGFVTGLLMHHLQKKFIFREKSWWKMGIVLLYAGFLITEAVLFCQGTIYLISPATIPRKELLLMLAAVSMVLGIASLLLNVLRNQLKTANYT